eukprot:TRINITY_DN2951_c0_g1_i1.p1 TRINITY_DN2951_c0_g1~~TRINITY_DN2951_c0_g1_i1.p1  ORF type:complete len:464 (+),score=155.35 TRINITY_DN2951_c0_g1_i1:175-1566(+)
MEAPTVFVVPPNVSLKCPIHSGVFNHPVIAPCGCSFCDSCIRKEIEETQECPYHTTPLSSSDLRPNSIAQAVVNDLLIYCRGGLQKSATTGDWIVNSNGCNMWISLGKRHEHEARCPIATELYNNDRQAIEPSPPILTCRFHNQGCLFIGRTDQEITFHQEESCGYRRLLNRIDELSLQLSEQDREIARLSALVNKDNTNNTKTTIDKQAIYDSLHKRLDQLDEDSQKVIAEAAMAIEKTKLLVKSKSTKAFQSSVSALHTIKSAIETAHAEILTKLSEMEIFERVQHLVLHNRRSAILPPSPSSSTTTSTTISSSTTTENNTTTPLTLQETTQAEIDKSDAISSSAVQDSSSDKNSSDSGDDDVVALEEDSSDNIDDDDDEDNDADDDDSDDNSDGDSDGDSDDDSDDDDSDEVYKTSLAASKTEYQRQEEARIAEENQFTQIINEAIRISLLHTTNPASSL